MHSAVAVLLIAFATVAAGQVPRPCRAPARVADPGPHLNDPDRFVWQLFVQVNVRAAAQVTFKATDGRTLTTNDALWETWADDPGTFPHDPDPAHPPVWPGSRSAKRVLEKGKGAGHARLPAPLAVPEGGGEEVRRLPRLFRLHPAGRVRPVRLPVPGSEQRPRYAPAPGLRRRLRS